MKRWKYILNYKWKKIDEKTKKYLERNKIYFETILMLIISVMGVIVSVAGIKVTQYSNKLTEQQMKILEFENAPSFILTSWYDKGTHVEHFYITNTGGQIRYGNMDLIKVLAIKIVNVSTGKSDNIAIILEDYYDSEYSNYDFDENVFKYSKSNNFPILTDVLEIIEEKVEEEGLLCSVQIRDFCFADIIDYKEEQKLIHYEIVGGKLYDSSYIKETSCMHWDIKEANIEDLYHKLDNEIYFSDVWGK